MIEFILHGYGSCALSMRKLWPLNKTSSTTYFLEGSEFDRFTCQKRWFPFSSHIDVLKRGIEAAVLDAERQIDEIIQFCEYRSNIPITLSGHSQGAIVSLELLRRYSANIAEVNCFAGYLPKTQLNKARFIPNNTKLNIFSSSIDRYINPIDVSRTAHFFEYELGVTVNHFETNCLSHELSHEWFVPQNFELRKK